MSKKLTLLLEDQRHIAESIRRNDELGERSLNFLVGVITVVIGGLVAMFIQSRGSLSSPELGLDGGTLILMRGTMLSLLLFSLLTYVRMLQRARVSREQQRHLIDLRGELAALGEAPAAYRTFLSEPAAWSARIGAVEMAGLFCGFLLGLLLVLCGAAGSAAALGGIALAAVCVMVAQYR